MAVPQEQSAAMALESGPDLPSVPRMRLILLTISLSCGLFLSLLDTTIVATALFTIGTDLKSLSTVTWVALAYTLSYLGCAVFFARIADIVGRKNAFISAFVIFFAFSLACGFAQSINQLIAFRALQGVGGSGLYSLTFVILPELCPPDRTQWVASLAGAVVALAGIIGPVLGGVITHYTTWRWIFWINAPIGIIPLLLFILAWPKPDQIRQIKRRSWKELDFVGGTLLIAASVLVVFSFEEAGMRENPWKTSLFLATLLLGCLCWFLLFGWEVLVSRFWEHRVASMLPLRLMRRRVYMGYVLNAISIGFTYYVVIYSLPMRMQVVNQKSQLISGLGLLPMIGTAGVGSALGGALNGKKNRIFATLLVASSSMLFGTGFLSTLPNKLAIPKEMYGYQVFVGLGFGLSVSTISMGAMIESQLRDTTAAQGIIAQMRVLGGSIGIAASTAILGVIQRRDLMGLVTPAELSTLELTAKTLSEKQLQAIRQAYSDAFAEDLRVCAIVSGISIFVTFLSFRRNAQGFVERRKEQIAEERQRQIEMRELEGGDSYLASGSSTRGNTGTSNQSSKDRVSQGVSSFSGRAAQKDPAL